MAKKSAEIKTYAERLELSHHLRELVIGNIIQALSLPSGSNGLDAGCGLGQYTRMLAEVISPDGKVTGIDIEPEFISQAGKINEDSGLSDNISFQVADINHLPFDENSFDWVWSMDTVWPGPKEMGCPAEDPLPIIAELARVVKPGGKIALAYWSSQLFLSGYPDIEAVLNDSSSGYAPFVAGMPKERHVMLASGWLRQAGMKNISARTFVSEIQAPLENKNMESLLSLIIMRWEGAQSEVPPKIWERYQRLINPESDDFILHNPDYYAFFTYTLFSGDVTG